MKRLGIDFGTKKIGLAMSDDGGTMAFPHGVVRNDANFLSYIQTLIQENHIEEVVIGHSVNNNNEPNPVHRAVEDFMTDLTLLMGIPIHLEPEQYSTKEAATIQGKNQLTDAAAAAIILNSFITKTSN